MAPPPAAPMAPPPDAPMAPPPDAPMAPPPDAPMAPPPDAPVAPPPDAPVAPPPAAPMVAPPVVAGGPLCAPLAALAAAMGVQAASGGSWLQQFSEVAERLPHAVAITDMKQPGLPVVWCNSQMVTLTGYPKSHTEGRNCRFLQGKKTEAAAVRTMVSSIRSSKATTIRVTNYKQNGSAFVNVLTLHPVLDSAGEYRYSVGILSDAAAASSEGAALETLRAALPTTFEASLQPRAFDTALTKVDEAAQRKQYRSSMIKFTRLVWSMDWEASLRSLLGQKEAVASLGQWLQKESPADAMQLELVVVCNELSMLPAEQRAQPAMGMCQKYLGQEPPDGDSAMAALGAAALQSLSALASEGFPKFVQSKACLPLVEALLGSAADELRLSSGVLWPKYVVPEDCAGWIHSFVSVAETYPACIVISDMAMPGNPMFFVNQEFSRCTGYAKHEAQGRNCRFLQGPKTEPQSVAVIQDTLRRGVDCHVKITNYRKSGDLFENLLTMRPVHDSNGVYRFCIAVQFEVVRDMSLKKRLAQLDKLVKLLPNVLEVSSVPTGAVHRKDEGAEELAASLEEKLQSALAGGTVGPAPTGVLADATEFEENHKTMLSEVSSGP
jgi:PAS domain S-box-containing protein